MTQILKYLQQEKSKFNFKVSVELEKTYEGMSDLGILADVVFVSKVKVQLMVDFGCTWRYLNH